MFIFYELQYSGGRSEQDFIDFLNEKCKSNRVSGGGVSDEVRLTISVLLNLWVSQRSVMMMAASFEAG